MLTEYNQNIADHYLAYRPPLHKLILNNVLKSRQFENGLDVGCGTGNSSIALKQFCSKVTGIDPSKHMINKAIQHKDVTYIHADLLNLPINTSSYDIITFAGSLFYTKSQELLDKLLMITQEKGLVVIYDFKIILNDICNRLFGKSSEKKSTYNHTINFSGLEQKELLLIDSKSQTLSFEITSNGLAHLILSSQHWYIASQQKYHVDEPFILLEKDLNEGSSYNLMAEVYYSVYEKNKSIDQSSHY